MQTQQGRGLWDKKGSKRKKKWGEPSVSLDPQENAPLQLARDLGDPSTQEREDHNANGHTLQ